MKVHAPFKESDYALPQELRTNELPIYAKWLRGAAKPRRTKYVYPSIDCLLKPNLLAPIDNFLKVIKKITDVLKEDARSDDYNFALRALCKAWHCAIDLYLKSEECVKKAQDEVKRIESIIPAKQHLYKRLPTYIEQMKKELEIAEIDSEVAKNILLVFNEYADLLKSNIDAQFDLTIIREKIFSLYIFPETDFDDITAGRYVSKVMIFLLPYFKGLGMPIDLENVKYHDHTFLEIVCTRSNDLAFIRLLLDQGANINGADQERIKSIELHGDHYSGKPLIKALEVGHYDVAKFLLSRGADPSGGPGKEGKLTTPLILAVKGQQKDIVAMLLRKGASIKEVDYRGKTAIKYAMKLVHKTPDVGYNEEENSYKIAELLALSGASEWIDKMPEKYKHLMNAVVGIKKLTIQEVESVFYELPGCIETEEFGGYLEPPYSMMGFLGREIENIFNTIQEEGIAIESLDHLKNLFYRVLLQHKNGDEHTESRDAVKEAIDGILELKYTEFFHSKDTEADQLDIRKDSAPLEILDQRFDLDALAAVQTARLEELEEIFKSAEEQHRLYWSGPSEVPPEAGASLGPVLSSGPSEVLGNVRFSVFFWASG